MCGELMHADGRGMSAMIVVDREYISRKGLGISRKGLGVHYQCFKVMHEPKPSFFTEP